MPVGQALLTLGMFVSAFLPAYPAALCGLFSVSVAAVLLTKSHQHKDSNRLLQDAFVLACAIFSISMTLNLLLAFCVLFFAITTAHPVVSGVSFGFLVNFYCF
jgi:hypothetical protein